MSDEEVAKVLAEIDVDGDANGLTFDEFVEILQKTQVPWALAVSLFLKTSELMSNDAL